MECNSEDTDHANGVYLEDVFLFSLSFFVLVTETFDRCIITFFYNWLKTALLFCFTYFPSFFLDVIKKDFYFPTARSRAIF